MKRFLVRLFIFCILFFAFDKLFFFVAEYAPEKEADTRLEQVLNGKMNKDIVVLGSSRGARDIITEQIGAQTPSSIYNLSYPGSNPLFHEFIFETLLKNNKAPQTLLYTVDEPTMFSPSPVLTRRPDRLYPLVKYKQVREELIRQGEKNKILSELFFLHRLSKSNFNLAQKHFEPTDTIFASGSMPISWQKQNMKWKFEDYGAEYDIADESKQLRKAFLNIVKICRDRNIQLVLVYPPNYGTYKEAFRMRIRNLTEGYAQHLYYDTTELRYKSNDFYYDGTHLNRKGAEIFTQEVITYLRRSEMLTNQSAMAVK